MPRGMGMGGGCTGAMMDPRSRFFAALASDQRLKLLANLREGEKSSADLTEVLELDPSVVSRHLTFLRNVGLVNGRKEGATLYFSIASEDVFRIVEIATGIIRDWLDQSRQIMQV